MQFRFTGNLIVAIQFSLVDVNRLFNQALPNINDHLGEFKSPMDRVNFGKTFTVLCSRLIYN